MARWFKKKVTVTTDASGDGTADFGAIDGNITKVTVKLGTATGFSITLAGADDTNDILQGQGASQTANMILTTNEIGVQYVNDEITATISGGGNVATLDVFVYWRSQR